MFISGSEMDCDSGECIVNDGTNDDSRYNSSCNRSITFTVVRAIVTITVIGLIIWALADALTTKNIEEWLVTWISIVEDHMFYGMFILVAIYIVAGILFVPQAMLSVGVGYAFGQAFPNMLYLSIPMAIISALIGACTGSVVCLLLGRYLFRDCAIRCAGRYRIFAALDRALAHNGFKIVVLMRLSPLVPNHILDYVSGITSIRIIDYTLASIGIIPSTVAFCYAGATASSISEGEENLHATNHKINTLILVVGLFFAVSGIVLISYYAKKELDEMLPSHISIEQQLQDDNNSYQPYHGSNPIGHANHTNTQQMYPASHLSSPRSITPTLQSLV